MANVDDPAWQVTTLFGRRVGLSQHNGRWSVAVDAGCVDGASLDDALCRAMRRSRRRSSRELSGSRR